MNLLVLFILSLATSAISITISSSKFFEGLRNWIALKSMWFGELLSCNYCLSHWVGLVCVLIYKPIFISCGNLVIDLIVSAFAIVALSNVISGFILKE